MTAALLRPAALLEYGGKRLPVSNKAVERSEVLSSLLRQAVGPVPTLALDSSQVASLQRLVGQPLPPLSLERFLAALGSGSGQRTVLERCSEVNFLQDAIADAFGRRACPAAAPSIPCAHPWARRRAAGPLAPPGLAAATATAPAPA